MTQYTVGIDYGTLSARAVLVDITDGSEVATSVFEYPHAILTSDFFDGVKLDGNWAIQHPSDYLDAASFLVRSLLEKSGVTAESIVGLGVDFTSSTVMPVLSDGTPLCLMEEFSNNPHAYVKLWKHHGAQEEADRITEVAMIHQKDRLASYGNKISSEWFFPKLYEIYNKAPDVYGAMERFVEAGDWVVWMLTGKEVHSCCMAGFKAMWSHADGYPDNGFWAKVDPGLGDIIGGIVSEKVDTVGSFAGYISDYGASLTGLTSSTSVAVPIIDAHASLPAAGITDEASLMMIMGTSSCHIVLSGEERCVPGICGSVRDGVIPGLVAYEAGQTCVGDCFDWFVKNCVPHTYTDEAKASEMNIFQYMTEKASNISAGDSKIVALDWWNGNRTPFADYSLSGMMVGLTINIKPEEIFRALLESTAFGTKAILDLYFENGIYVERIIASGGIANKNPLLMQIYADVIGKPIVVASSDQSGAKGSAIYAAVAGGVYPDIKAAALKMVSEGNVVYLPDTSNTGKYANLYGIYKRLSDFFGKDNSSIMRELSD